MKSNKVVDAVRLIVFIVLMSFLTIFGLINTCVTYLMVILMNAVYNIKEKLKCIF